MCKYNLKEQANDFAEITKEMRFVYAGVQPITQEVMEQLFPWIPKRIVEIQCRVSYAITDTIYAGIQRTAEFVANKL